MMLVTPMLIGNGKGLDLHVFQLIGIAFAILALIFISAIRIVPKLLHLVARTRSRELFLLTVFVICFGVAWVASSVGLSLALGAFLAGLIISESEYSFQAIGDVIPFQDIFTSFFFVSVGMLLDFDFFIKYPFSILFISLGVFLLKSCIVGFTTLILGMPIRTAVLSGLALSQVGEFSFVLASFGIISGIGTDYLHQLFLAVAVVTMGVTPTLITISPKIAIWVMGLPLPQKLKSGLGQIQIKEEKKIEGHVVIIGYGFSGRNLARSTREAGVPYMVFDVHMF